MKKYFINCLLVMALFILGCSSNSDYINNGTFAVSAASTALTPGSGTIISAKYTTTADLILDGNRTSFTSNRPDLVNFNSTSVNSDGNGAASTGLTVITTAQIPVGGVDVVITATFRGLSSNVVIHINPGTGTRLSLTAPNSANTGTSFALTATLTPLITGKVLTFSSDNPNLVSFSTLTSVTDGSGSTVTVVSIKSTVAIPTEGLDIALSVTDGTFSTAKVIHINPLPANNTSITFTAPVAATSGSSFTTSAIINPPLIGKTISFSSNRSDLISFYPQSNITDGTGSATTVVTVNSASSLPPAGVDVAFSVTDGTVNALKVIHVNPISVNNATITLSAPTTATSDSSFTITAGVSPLLSGKSISFSSNRVDLISFNPPTTATDGTGSAITAISVDPLMTLPPNGVDVIFSATDGAVTTVKVVHINPSTANNTILTINSPNLVSSGSSFTVTSGVTPILSGKNISFSSNRSDLVGFVPATATTDGTGTAITAVSVNQSVTIPANGIDVTFTATDGIATALKVVHLNPSSTTGNVLKLALPALVDRGSSYPVTAVLNPVVAGNSITFSSNSPAINFSPALATTDGTGTAKSSATVSPSVIVPQNGLDVTISATDGTVSDLQVVHINGAVPPSFTIFPANLDISNVAGGGGVQTTIQIVPTTSGTYNFSAASRAPFIVQVNSVNNATGVITLSTASVDCHEYNWFPTGTVIIEIKDNSPFNTGPTLYYPVTYSLCW